MLEIIISIVVAVLTLIVIPMIRYQFQLNTRLVKLEDKCEVIEVIFSKIDKLTDNINDIKTDVHTLTIVQKIKESDN
jgi:cell division protein FtsL